MVDYELLNKMLDAALAKETCESWNQFLDDCYADSHQIDIVSTLDVSTFCVSDPMTWNQGNNVEKNNVENNSNRDSYNPYAIAA